PSAAARSFSQGQRLLASRGGVRARLAKRYIPGLSPGEHPGVGLGGKVAGSSRGAENAWRQAYLTARAHEGLAGFADYNFLGGNKSATVLLDTFSEIARALR